MGLDSLMAVELRNWIEGHLEVSLPISALMRSQSLGGLVHQISDAIGQTVLSATAPSPTIAATSTQTPGALTADSGLQWTKDQAGQLLENLDQLTDEQVRQLLSQALEQQ
jgi:hypothetical protein